MFPFPINIPVIEGKEICKTVHTFKTPSRTQQKLPTTNTPDFSNSGYTITKFEQIVIVLQYAI